MEGEYVRMSVRDHGPGFAEEDLPHVKERFYKGRGKERGSGIGLAVCDEIVTRHGGRAHDGQRRGRRRAGERGAAHQDTVKYRFEVSKCQKKMFRPASGRR